MKALAALALLGLGQSPYGDAGTPDPAFAPYGIAAYRAVEEVCLPNADGLLPFTRDNAAALAAADVRRVEQPQEWKLRSVTLDGGRLDYAERPSSGGRLFLASLPPGKLCQAFIFDAPGGGRIWVSLDAALRDHAWRLLERHDGFEVTRRSYQHFTGRKADALLELVEFVDGGGPVRHTRLRLTVKSFRPRP